MCDSVKFAIHILFQVFTTPLRRPQALVQTCWRAQTAELGVADGLTRRPETIAMTDRKWTWKRSAAEIRKKSETLSDRAESIELIVSTYCHIDSPEQMYCFISVLYLFMKKCTY